MTDPRLVVMVILILALLGAWLSGEAQQPSKVSRIGYPLGCGEAPAGAV
jgi:hypothetical protein